MSRKNVVKLVLALILTAAMVICVTLYTKRNLDKPIASQSPRPLTAEDNITVKQFTEYIERELNISPEDILHDINAELDQEMLLTREYMCLLGVNIIDSSDHLLALHIPSRVSREVGEESIYFNRLFSGAEYVQGGGYGAELLALRKSGVVKMQVYSAVYSDTYSVRIFEWGEKIPFDALLLDYDLIDVKCRDAVEQICDMGLVSCDFGEDLYGLMFMPNEPVTLADAAKFVSLLLDPLSCMPVGCMPVDYIEGTEFDYGDEAAKVLIRFDTTEAFYIISELRDFFDSNAGLSYMLAAFDTSNVNMSMWFGTEEMGAYYFPFDARNVTFEIPLYDTEATARRISIMEMMLPVSFRADLRQWVNSVLGSVNASSERFGSVEISYYSIDVNIASFILRFDG